VQPRFCACGCGSIVITKTAEYVRGHCRIGQTYSLEYRAALRRALNRPEVIAKFSSIHRNQHIKQTRPEAMMHAALGSDWRYVGNVRLNDGSSNPDAPYADNLPISPDIIHRTERIMVMVDGCYWHECPQHGSGRRPYVRQRDAYKQKLAEAAGWIVVRVWEHDVHEDVAVIADRIETGDVDGTCAET
jgi:very-short-patch-repair endonuclease